MLDFWYSEQCTREIKLVSCIVTCVMIYYFSTIAPLEALYVCFALAIGVLFHVLRLLDIKLNQQNKYAEGFKVIFFTIRILAVIFLVQALPETNKLSLIAQSLGFICLGFFLVTIYENRAKRFNS
ncbi:MULTISPECIES: hypothetical protein [Acinetobacter]|uniref:hypothetical protein n=1 Tax=Acinetobacter TaxID=469 RepID=UPI00279BF87F|nr:MULTISPECIES: hypothetical protein [Acinetobacter]MDY6483560.1 hypothetical protein [Acinetobacter faecalis]WFP97165.1 hypothetical protein P3S51_02065 [Acinetobacter sp. ANC 7201]